MQSPPRPTVCRPSSLASSTATRRASIYLGALDRGRYAPLVNAMVEAAIDRDREHRYISQLLPALWGDDFMARAEQLRISDNNFRRIYKRIYPDH